MQVVSVTVLSNFGAPYENEKVGSWWLVHTLVAVLNFITQELMLARIILYMDRYSKPGLTVLILPNGPLTIHVVLFTP